MTRRMLWVATAILAATVLAGCVSITTSSSGRRGGYDEHTPTGEAAVRAAGLGPNAPARVWTDGASEPLGRSDVNSRTFIELADAANPAIVSIFTTTDLRVGVGDPLGIFRVPVPDADIQASSLGTGFFISEDGFLLTNAHVIAKADDIHVFLHDDSIDRRARVIGVDPLTDLALLKVDHDEPLPYLRLADSDAVERGEWVVAIGNPFGLDYSITTGVVSAKNRVLSAGSRRGLYEDFLQTSAQINPGNSGGPLLNLKGEVVGINTAMIAGAQGIGFAIPANLAKDMLPSLARNGRILRGYAGIGLADLNPAIKRKFQVRADKGAMVVTLDPNGPGAAAGIKRGDVIVSVDGEAVTTARDTSRRITVAEAGQTVNLEVDRGGTLTRVSLTIARRE